MCSRNSRQTRCPATPIDCCPTLPTPTSNPTASGANNSIASASASNTATTITPHCSRHRRTNRSLPSVHFRWYIERRPCRTSTPWRRRSHNRCWDGRNRCPIRIVAARNANDNDPRTILSRNVANVASKFDQTTMTTTTTITQMMSTLT